MKNNSIIIKSSKNISFNVKLFLMIGQIFQNAEKCKHHAWVVVICTQFCNIAANKNKLCMTTERRAKCFYTYFQIKICNLIWILK